MPGAGGGLSGPLQLNVCLVAAHVGEHWDLPGTLPPSATSTLSGADGMFLITWFPGTYYLFAESDGKMLRAGPFVIESGRTTRVDLVAGVVY